MSKNKNKLPGNDEIIKRSFGVTDFRAADEEKTVDGHPAVYDQKTSIGDYFYEVIERGAFDGTDFDDVLFCVNHDLRKIPIARSRRNNGNSTMQLQTDDKGLYVKARLDTEENSEARSLYSSIKRGDMDGMSFIFTIADAKWTDLDTDMPTRHILKIRKVYEVGAVNMPAYSGTDISARDQSALDNAIMALDNARSELDNSKSELEVMKLKTQIKLKG
jgi:HK97 family phage prohead protease